MLFDILTIVPGRKKLSHSGWHSFNAICCNHRGHTIDKRGRGGIRLDGDNWSMHCFNCGFKCGFTLGKNLSKNTKQFLNWCGIDESQIQKWSLESLKHKDLLSYLQVKKNKLKVKFKDHTLPEGEMIDIGNSSHKVYVDYLKQRCINPIDYPFMVTPSDSGRMGNRIVIPYTYHNKIVGHTSRFLDNKTPKYINEQQPGFVFGIDFQKPEWQVCILVEGIFDALSINACALTHNTISEEQASILSQLNRRIIFVPDRDKTGLETIDRALELGYSVSIPNWDSNIKDVNDAVIKYGKLMTLMSILQHATTSKIKIELQRKKIGKQNGF
jgi:DNA primase